MRVFALLRALFAASSPAGAGDPWTPDWKMIAGDGSVLPSDCIGSTETLDCFIDTLAACSAWSEATRWRKDAKFYDHPVCTNVPGFEGLSVLWSLGPAATQLFLFRTDVWTLERPQDWLVDKEHWDLARAGDTVIDFFSTTCSPNPRCLSSLGAGTTSEQTLAACPRSACFFGVPSIVSSPVLEPPQNVALYLRPDMTLLVRSTADGWRVIDWYNPLKFGLHGTEWVPNHWKLK